VNEDFGNEWNKKIFGKCFESNHGHNFLVEVELVGEVERDTGMVINFQKIKDVIDFYDHTDLNVFFPTNMPSTAENFVMRLGCDLEKMYKDEGVDWYSMKVTVWETENACVEAHWKVKEIID
jgi:6-pyruvoyltetrahydropterin/6-carboxytetrahydropterin synthase